MPYKFDFDLANGILRTRFKGRVTDEVFREFFQIAFEHAVRTQPRAGVVDFSGVTSFEVSAQAVKELATTTPVLRDPNIRRIVIASSPATYGMMRMFEIEGEQTRPNFHVVRTEREAWGILAVRKPRFNPI
jgi:hypothetical protein